MRYTKLVPAAVLALLAAACDAPEELVSPEPAALPPVSAPDRIVDTDLEMARVAREEIPGFAGYYLQNDGTPVVRVVDMAQAARAEEYVVRTLGPIRGRQAPMAAVKIKSDPVVLQAAYDFNELKNWAEQLTPLLTSNSNVYTVDVDEVNNRVLLGVASAAVGGAVRSEATRLGIPAAAVGVETQGRPETRATLSSTFNPFVGGIQIAFGGYLCTAGFNAKRSSNNANIFVTNAHCTGTQYALDGISLYQPSVLAGNLVGAEVHDRGMYACITGVASCRRADAAYISHNGSRTIGQGGIARTAWATGGRGGLTVTGEYDIVGRYTGAAPVGTWLDKTGRTSGSTYGQVTSSCVTIGSLRCQDISSVWSEGGDSGSPMYVYLGGAGTAENDVQLYGILWGGPNGNWNVTYSSRLSGIELDLGALNSLCRPGYGC